VTILVLRALGLGDLLVAVPALRGLRRAFPGERIVLATAPELARLAHASGAVDEVLPARGLADPLSFPPPDLAVNLHGSGPESHRLLDELAPSARIGFRSAGWPGPDWDDGEHEADRWCRLLDWHGIPADPTDLLLPWDPPERGHVIVHPGAQYGCRRWPPDRYAQVAAALVAEGDRVLVTGSAAEAALVAAPPGAEVVAGKTDVAELAGLVAGARLVICGDTGVAHLATAFGTPSVLLFGPVSPRLWGPRTDGPHTVLWRSGLVRGDRWASDPDPALLAITVPDVLAACATAAPSREVR
jgi:ADP-heptose:LPS heptosyltransferase